MLESSIHRLATPGITCAVLAAVLSLVPVVPCTADVEPIGVEVGDHPSGRWSTILSSGGPTRMLYATAWDTQRDRMLIFGGHPLAFNDVWELDPSVPEWKEMPTGDPMPSPRYGASAIYDPVNDRLVVYGGWTSTFTYDDVWALSLSGEPTWTQLFPAGPPPPSRTYHAAVYDPVNHRMVVFGGVQSTNTSSPVFLEDTWTLSLGDSPAWTRVSGPQPSARNLMSGVYDPIHQRMIIFGGWTGVGYLNDTWSLSLAGTPSWTQLSTSTAPGPRREYAMAYDSETDRTVLFGGFTGLSLADPLGRLDDVWQLDGQTNQWQFVQSGQPPATRRCSAGAVFDPVGRRMIVLGGYGLNPSGQLAYLDQTLALSLSGAPGWSDLFGSQATPSRRREGVAVYDPDHGQMIQFSGTQPAGPLDRDVWRLSLNGPPLWTRKVVPNGPTSRHGHGAVWDSPRHRMLVFGGYSDQVVLNYMNDIWELRLDPTPAWTQLTTTGTPPSPRMLFGMVHDTREDRLLIFGGHPTFLNDVWELPLSGPDALHWHQLTPSGAPPAPRWGMSMVYDRDHDRAIIFGGTSTNTTGRDDTWALDLRGGDAEWTELETGVARPAPRLVHSAIFDEKRGRMVVFGGATGLTFYDDVWEMSPSRHRARWEPLAPDGASPGPRDLHSAIYDVEGDRMVLFGGFQYPSTYFADTWFLEWDRGRGRDQAEDGGDIIVNKGGAQMLAPSASAPAVLALTRIHPNPSSGPISITFSLPRRSSATLDLVDVAGRVVQRQDVGGLGPGTHTVSMGRQERLSAGIYFVSLTQDGKRLYRRYSVVK